MYKELPIHLEKQLSEMKKHVEQYKEHYPVDAYEKWIEDISVGYHSLMPLKFTLCHFALTELSIRVIRQ